MFNLLPEPEKKQILNEYSTRRLDVALFFLFIIGLISVISIFPSFVLSSVKVTDSKRNIDAIKNSSILKEADQLNSQLSQANQKLLALRPPKQEISMSTIFQAVIADKSTNVRLSSFLLQNGTGATGDKVIVRGVARTREDLSAFVSQLKKDPLFTNVDLPVSSFAKDQNADFSITISGAF
jgi:Tfp pilus assembly protein PilN